MNRGAVCPVPFPFVKKGTRERPNIFLVHLVLFSVQVCFSGWNVLAKVALNDGVNAVALAMAREACATILMFIIARRVDGIVSLDPAHAVRFFWMGLASCGNVVGSMLALRPEMGEAVGSRGGFVSSTTSRPTPSAETSSRLGAVDHESRPADLGVD